MCSEKDKQRTPRNCARTPKNGAERLSLRNRNEITVTGLPKGVRRSLKQKKEKADLERTRGGAKDEKERDRLSPFVSFNMLMAVRAFPFSQPSALPFFLRSLEPLRSRSRSSRKSVGLFAYVCMY